MCVCAMARMDSWHMIARWVCKKTMNGIDLSFGKQLPYMNQHADIKNKTIDDDRDHLETGVT